ncbi:PKD domain-containing protein [Hyalangium rubrum]|uniref:PKD domain-containing protein n=1 Tax=Hyalangium rubrum TaxID=3103134 RepID=A0ABU5GUT6_9BACT|nr:PKD domain-containing protein [Hyalangium sp. s54d21]MDY7224940.1 PKD domain-containing protein [Hyalangium sp. s54d21]
MVPLTSSVVVDAIETDRSWVCEGEPLGLSARFGGVAEPGAVYRWVWLTERGEAELHPGPTLSWKAPDRAGRYAVRFQVCKDLGGRRVGVLAERLIEIDVRSCGRGERQEYEPLRLAVTQRGQGAFSFQASYQGSERVEAYVWEFGDGSTTTTSEPQVEHAYAVQGMGAQETRSFTVKLSARLSRGGPLSATAFVQTRGQPASDELHPVVLEVSRWRPMPEGGWRSEVVARSVSSDITWDRLERVTQRWDGGVDVTTRKWSEVVRVDEGLERGGFRGHVRVSPSEAPPGTKQILDFLYGYDATGQEVVVSWSSFKSEAPPEPPKAVEPPPRK